MIIVTTVGKGCTRAFRDRKFKRVIMDEATMVRENEAFLSMIDAEQIVLVGDQKQLGPTFRFKIDGPSSMFSRLIQAGMPYDFLDTQYRMHPALLKVPNTLYYNHMIKSEYKVDPQKRFMFAASPFLFIDVPQGTETLKGTSFYNNAEAKVIN